MASVAITESPQITMSPEEQLREVMIELAQRKKANPLAFFIPNGKQEEIVPCDKFVNVFSGGNGSGKSYVGINIFGNLVYGPQSKWFQHEVYNKINRPLRGRIVSTHKNVEENIVPLLESWLIPGSYTARKGTRTFLSDWKFANGTEMDIMTYDTDPEQFEGPTIHFIWFDEPPPRKIWGAATSRLRKGGFILITMTPLYSGGWIFDRINDPFSNNQRDWALVSADVEDNCMEHGVRGTLQHKDIARILVEYPPEEREARKSGKPIHLAGRVYPTFNVDVHVIPREKAPTEGTIYHVCDPHDRKPFALGWALIDKTGDVYIIEEWPDTPFHEIKSCAHTLKDYKGIIEGKELLTGNPIIRIIDARYGNRKSVQTGDTIRDELDMLDLHYINSYTDDDASIVAGHNKVRSVLYCDPEKPIDTTNKPKLFICDNCINHIYQMLHYTHANHRDPEKSVKEQVEDKFKDFPDLIRYLVMENPTYIKEEELEEAKPIPQSWEKYRQEVALTSYGE